MQNLLDPAILFFVFGVLAGLVRSNLEIPAAVSRFLSLYLLMALGLKGGFALAHSGFSAEVLHSLFCAVLLALAVPALGYLVLRRFLKPFDALAVASTYGSVSAVTFITAVAYLERNGLPYGGHMAAAMALMESPAIVLAVLMANHVRQGQAAGSVQFNGGGTASLSAGGWGGQGRAPGNRIGHLLHESFTDGAQLLLLGAMAVGLVSGDAGKAAMQPFSGDLFKGMLAFFMLDMGLNAARQLPQLRGQSPWVLLYAVLGPFTHAFMGLGLACLAGLPAGDAGLLMVLAGSASYIAVPAVLRYAVPEANQALYFGLSLGLTFPLNVLLGVPFYMQVAHAVLG
ncbi:sodium-dependent bicarbonate transport family permease [Curvibacter lanceolatus]|uniref:sodium-dependent bicarbonate transport family permease n=1 Tax=Curvibacter lanceolatus TaxID=86182 RepID=UPI000360AED1|nr:sodium-dependent bicarbonate transport family permease [Curvibacter lanceolatus]